MSEFAPICIYLVISLLVSLIPLGVPFPFSSNCRPPSVGSVMLVTRFYCTLWLALEALTSVTPLKEAPLQIQRRIYAFVRIFSVIAFSRLSFGVGYLLMDELSAAVAQFDPSVFGGMFPGLPGPSGGGPDIIPVQPPEQPENEGAAPAERGLNLAPLISEEQRREELRAELKRLIDEGLVKKELYSEALINKQFEFELKLEEALRREGYTDESIFSNRARWRWAAYYPDTRSTPISAKTLHATMGKYTDITKTLNYKRVLRTARNEGDFLQKNSTTL
jgi:hypothetical protein